MSPIFIPPFGGSTATVGIQGASPLDPRPKQMARNSLYPTAANTQKLRAMTNHIARYRTRQLACFVTTLQSPPSPTWNPTDPTSRVRWRSCFRSSPFGTRIRAVVTVHRQDPNAPSASSDYVIVEVASVSGVFVGSSTFPAGPPTVVFPDDYAVGPENLFHRFGVLQDTAGLQGGFTAEIPQSPTDDYQIVVTEVNGAIALACTVYEEALPADMANGYIDTNLHVSTPITSQSRQDVADILRSMWQKGAAHLISWSRLLDVGGAYAPATTASLLPKNLVDNSSTVVSTATPGYTVDLTNCTRLSTASQGVRVFFAAYGKCTTNGHGDVYMKNSAGTTLVSVTGFGTSLGWLIGSGYIPAAVGKYDLMFATDAGTLTVEAVSVWMGDY